MQEVILNLTPFLKRIFGNNWKKVKPEDLGLCAVLILWFFVVVELC